MTSTIPCGLVKATGVGDNFNVIAGGIDTKAIISIGDPTADNDADTADDRLGMPDAIDNDIEFVGVSEGMLGDFARNVHTRTIDDVRDEVTVFDNRDDPVDVKYSDFYTVDDAGMRDAVTTATAVGVLTLATDDIKGNGDLFSSMDFPVGDRQRVEYPADDDTTDDVDESRARTFDGMFNRVPGEYSCTGTTCVARNDADGILTFLEGTWTFTPEEIEDDADPHMIENAKYDDDYLAFGFWLQSEGEGSRAAYGIGTFAGGSMAFGGAAPLNDAVSALMGTATYSGRAAGMFVMKTDIDDDNLGAVPTQAGKFTAEAELTAQFGATTLTADSFTISGVVEDFVTTNYDGTSVDNVTGHSN